VVLGACEAGPAQNDPVAGSPSVATTTAASVQGSACRFVGEPIQREGPTVEGQVVSTGGGDAPRVEAFVYPHPDYEGDPWSQWGQGLILADGRFLSAIGDHLGADGNSFLYEYSPETDTLTKLFDVLSLTQHQPGSWGYGKVHAQMVPAPCDDVYFATYWGSREGVRFDASYQGDRLFRFDPDRDMIDDLGTPVPRHGLPSLAWAHDGLLYGEAPDPRHETDQGPFFAYDPLRRRAVFLDDDPAHTGFRNVAVDADGRAYYSMGNGVLRVYDPRTGEARDDPQRMPGEWLRASTRPAPDGTVYAVTTKPDVFFAIEPSGEIRTIGPARGYTASIALDPEGTRILYIPGAYGDSWEQGSPLVSLDPVTGDEDVIVELNRIAERELGLRLGGTYDIAVDPGTRTVYIGMNAGQASSGESFGEVVLLLIHLP
jgi:hypothetical protein